MLIHARGDEYAGKYPLWDWQLLPGTTVLHDNDTRCEEHFIGNSTSPPTNESCWCDCYNSERIGRTRFAGGASTGTTGVMTRDYTSAARPHQPVLSLRQTTFFFEGMVLQLLCNMRVSHSHSRSEPKQQMITTSLDQRQLRSNVYFGRTNSSKSHKLAGHATVPKGAGLWVHHDNIGYVVLGMSDAAELILHRDLNSLHAS